MALQISHSQQKSQNKKGAAIWQRPFYFGSIEHFKSLCSFHADDLGTECLEGRADGDGVTGQAEA